MYTISVEYLKFYIKHIFKALLIIIPVLILVLLYQPGIDLGDGVIENPIYNKFEWWILLLYYIIFIFIFGILFFIPLLLYFTIQKERIQKLESRLINFFIHALVDFLYSEKYNSNKEEFAFYRTIGHFIKRKNNIEAFFIALTRIQESLKIDLSEKYCLLIKELNLNKTLIKFLYSFNLSDRIIAIKIISYLRINDAIYIKRIDYYLNSKNFALRSEAYAGLIRLFDRNMQLSDFISSKHHLSLIDINGIVNAVLRNTRVSIDYIDLLSSPLEHKSIIGLLLSKSRHVENSRDLIISHIGSSSPLLKSLAWEAYLANVSKNEAVEIIMGRFKDEPDDIQVMILKNSHKTYNKRFYQFLLEEVIPAGSLLVKIEAIRILFNENFASLTTFHKSDNEQIRIAYREVVDININ